MTDVPFLKLPMPVYELFFLFCNNHNYNSSFQTWGQLQNLDYNYTFNYTPFVKLDTITITP